jgi:hypothetical protein
MASSAFQAELLRALACESPQLSPESAESGPKTSQNAEKRTENASKRPPNAPNPPKSADSHSNIIVIDDDSHDGITDNSDNFDNRAEFGHFSGGDPSKPNPPAPQNPSGPEKRAQNASKSPENAPKTGENAPKTGENGPKTVPARLVLLGKKAKSAGDVAAMALALDRAGAGAEFAGVGHGARVAGWIREHSG